MSVPHPVPKRGGYLPVSLAEARQATGLAPGPFALWVGLGLATESELPRRFVLERAGLPVTADTVKKLPANLRAIESAGLAKVTIDGDRVRFQPRPAPVRPSRTWNHARLWRADFDRALTPDDPLTVSLLQAWVCRWLPVLRHDRVQVAQADLADRWGIARATVIREADRLAEVGLLTIRRSGGASIMADARLDLPDTAPIRRLGQSCNLSTGKVAISAPTSTDTPSTARAGGPRHHALDTPATTRQGRYSSTARKTTKTGACGPGTEQRKPTPQTRGTAPETVAAWRLVWQHRWIATAPRRVRYQIAAMLGRLLRLTGPPGLAGLWTPERLDRMLADADPGAPTTDHARIIRAGLSGLAADAKAGEHPAGHGSDPAEPPAEHTPAEATQAEVQAMAEASLAAVGTSATSPGTAATGHHTSQDHRGEAAGRMRGEFVALAEAGPPTDPGRIPDFLTGVLIIRAERTGLPVPTVAARLRIAPEHDHALETAAGTAAMITHQREAVPA